MRKEEEDVKVYDHDLIKHVFIQRELISSMDGRRRNSGKEFRFGRATIRNQNEFALLFLLENIGL